jgi:hypothetical protein
MNPPKIKKGNKKRDRGALLLDVQKFKRGGKGFAKDLTPINSDEKQATPCA